MNNEYASQEASDRFEAEQRFVRRMEPIAQEIADEICEEIEQLNNPCEDEISDLKLEVLNRHNLPEDELEFVLSFLNSCI